jgi:hypothetical protein
MVEETNTYYKNGLHQCYRVFEKAAVFNRLRTKYAAGGEPTVQEIIAALGVPSTGQPHEAGLAAIDAHLEREGRPMMQRDGEWDREISSAQNPSPEFSSDEEMDDEPDESPQDEQRYSQHFLPLTNPIAPSRPNNAKVPPVLQQADSQYKSPSPTAVPLVVSLPPKIATSHNALTSSYLAQLNAMHSAASPNSSPIQPGTPESVALSHYSYTMSPQSNLFAQSQENLGLMDPNCAPLGGLSLPLGFNDPMNTDGTVRLSDVELQNPDPFDYWPYGPSLADRAPFAV